MKSIKINEFDLKLDTIYQVMPKYDGSAPDGWRKERTTKALAPWGRNIEGIPFNDHKKVWDTGLYESSPSLSNRREEEVNDILSFVEKNIVRPLEDNLYGEGALDHKDVKDSFWLDYSIDLYNGRIFNTSDPRQLLDLYLCILHGKLCPKGKAESSPYYPFAQFTVENKEHSRSVQQENELLTVEAMGEFYSMLNNNKDRLKLVMNYVGVNIPVKASDGVYTTSFTSFINHRDNSRFNKEEFIEASKKAKEKEGYQELYFYDILGKLFKKKIVTREREFFMFEGTELGTSLKEAARKVAKETTIQAELLKHIENKK